MHAHIAFLKAAVARGPMAGIKNCYSIHDGYLTARNEQFQAGVPYTDLPPSNIPADELDAALGRMPSDPACALRDGVLVVRCGRLRSSIQCIDGEPPSLPALDGDWASLPERMIWALGLAAPFVSDQPGWSSGINLGGGKVIAVNNRCGIEIQVPGLDCEPCLITAETAAFIAAQEAPERYRADGNSLAFMWPDGRWLKAQVMNYKAQDVSAVFDSAGTGAPAAVTDDWRTAFADIAALAENTVEINAEAIIAGRGASMVDVAMETDLPSPTFWEGKNLSRVVAIAQAWNPAAYPKAALFIGDGFRGLVLGVRR